MDPLSFDSLARFWSSQQVAAGFVVFLNVLGAGLLGLLVGYERSYHGRAAGMRTYALVCMASCALTVIGGYSGYWFGGSMGGAQDLAGPTRVIQGIVTGVGFLGAGVIMKEGFNISGLTTAASIWYSSAIGILVGVGFYFSAILVTVVSAALMMWALRIERWLPSHPAFAITLRFRPTLVPQERAIAGSLRECGLALASGTVQIQQASGSQEWRFVAISDSGRREVTVSNVAERLRSVEGVEDFQVTPARN